MLRPTLALLLLGSTACLPPPPREQSYPSGTEVSDEISKDDLRALCDEGHAASCEMLGEAGVKHGDVQVAGMGTCFAITADGTLVTAAHVVEGADAVVVQFGDDEMIDAKVTKLSSGVDLAVLQIEQPTPRFVPIDPAAQPALGQRVFTVGFPEAGALGLDPKFAEGAISGMTGLGQEHFFQTSVPVLPGNSGGAVVSEDGHLVGVVVAKMNDQKFYESTGSLAGSISFATKLSYLAPMLPAVEPTTPLDRDAAIRLLTDATCQVWVGKRAR